MTFRITQVSSVFCRTAYTLFLLLLAAVAFVAVQSGLVTVPVLLLILLGLAAGVLLLCLSALLGERLGAKWSLIFLLVLCLAVKLGWVLFAHIAPDEDFAVFDGYSASLAQNGFVYGGRYMALFPHIFGYSLFLSIFKRIFGDVSILAPVLNAVLSTIAGGLIFSLCRKLSGLRTAVIAFLLWIICPSQTIYNMYTLSEPLYTTGILLFLLIVTRFDQRTVREKPLRSIPPGLLAGLVLALVNLARPVSAILIIALLLWLGPGRLDHWPEKAFSLGWLLFLIFLAAGYGTVGRVGTSYLTHCIGETPSSFPGYNICVGLNQTYGGKWNPDDSELLFSYSDRQGSTAEWVQEQMLKDATARFDSGQINIPKLFHDKLFTFLGRDDVCVGLGTRVLRHRELLSLLSNSFYYFCLILAAIGGIAAWRKTDRSALFLVILYFIGLTFAHMLVEVAGRYHYSLFIPLIMFGAYGGNALGSYYKRAFIHVSLHWRLMKNRKRTGAITDGRDRMENEASNFFK